MKKRGGGRRGKRRRGEEGERRRQEPRRQLPEREGGEVFFADEGRKGLHKDIGARITLNSSSRGFMQIML